MRSFALISCTWSDKIYNVSCAAHFHDIARIRCLIDWAMCTVIAKAPVGPHDYAEETNWNCMIFQHFLFSCFLIKTNRRNLREYQNPLPVDIFCLNRRLPKKIRHGLGAIPDLLKISWLSSYALTKCMKWGLYERIHVVYELFSTEIVDTSWC